MQSLPTSGIIYFLGIGGIGMSALARYFLENGWDVYGYDKTSTPLTTALSAEGMHIHFNENPGLIPAKVDLVVYTPAVPVEHAEYRYFAEKGLKITKRAELLGMISDGYRTVAIAGTHGKTTTTTLAAHLLNSSIPGCQAFLGGISKNYESNLILSSTSPFLVAEADEFDRSFLHLHPEIAVITSMDADHLDIYGNHDSLLDSFRSFAGNIRKGGALIVKKGLEQQLDELKDIRVFTYGTETGSDFYPSGLYLADGLYHFDFHYPGGIYNNMILGIPGLYNVENAVAALAASWLCEAGENGLRTALASFEGVRRRFDIRVQTGRTVYIDDYAHHPAELEACITSAGKLFPGKKLTGIFQPHLYSRTRDFADAFASSLQLLDEVILLPIYPAREEPIAGITSEMLLAKITGIPKRLAEKGEFPDCIDRKKIEVLLTMGAGDIDTLAGPIEDYLKSTEA